MQVISVSLIDDKSVINVVVRPVIRPSTKRNRRWLERVDGRRLSPS